VVVVRRRGRAVHPGVARGQRAHLQVGSGRKGD
jgi:hypothetical protein